MDNRRTQDPIAEMEHWGYHLLPRPHPLSPGFTGLLVAIRDLPTVQHFDPEFIRLSLLNLAGSVEESELTLSTPLARAETVCPGPITLVDRRNKEEAFYSFGATVQSTPSSGEIVFAIRSSAPIVWLSRATQTPADQLVAEFGRLIGEARAECCEGDDDFFARLAGIEPLALYAAALATIFADYEKVEELRDSYPELHSLLHEEKGWLEANRLWSENPITLRDLLKT